MVFALFSDLPGVKVNVSTSKEDVDKFCELCKASKTGDGSNILQ